MSIKGPRILMSKALHRPQGESVHPYSSWWQSQEHAQIHNPEAVSSYRGEPARLWSLDLTEKSHPTTHGKKKIHLWTDAIFLQILFDSPLLILDVFASRLCVNQFLKVIRIASEENQPHLMASPDHSKTRPGISATFGLEAGNKYTADTESSQRKITDD